MSNQSVAYKDKQKTVHVKNDLATLAYGILRTISDRKLGNFINYNDRKRMENMSQKTIAWIYSNLNANIEQFEYQKKQLEHLWKPIISQAYAKASAENTSNCSEIDINDEKSEYIQQLLDERSKLRLQLANEKRQNTIHNNTIQSKTKQINKLKSENNIVNTKLRLKNKQFNKLECDYKELETKFNQKLQSIGYESWHYTDVFQWIINIENQRFKKYEQNLYSQLKEECIDGTCLDEMDANDLHRLGITQFKDKKVLMKHIKNLMRQNNEHKNDENKNGDNEGASTGYI